MSLAAALLLASLQGPVVVMAASADPSGSGSSEWVGEAVAQLLPRALSRRGLAVIDPEDRLEAHLRLGIPARDPSRATTVRVADALGARTAVVGEYRVTERGLELSVRPLDLTQGSLGDARLSWGSEEAIGALLDQLATALAGPAPPEGFAPEATAAFARSFGGPRERRRELLERALELAPDLDPARLALGRFLFEIGERREAREAWARIGPGPSFRRARFLTAVSLLEAGESAEAAPLFEALATETPTAAAFNNEGVAWLRARVEDGPRRARVALERAAALAPDAPAIWFNEAWARLVSGDPVAAASQLAAADPRDLHARLARCWALKLAGDADWEREWTALVSLEEGYEAFEEPDLERRLERVLASEHPLVLGASVRSDEELAAVHLGRAGKLLSEGAADAAIGELTRAVYLDPHGARGHLLLGRAYRARGQAPAAVQELRMSLWCRDDPDVRVELAELLEEMGRSEEARREAARVLERDPGNERALRLAGTSAVP